MKKLLIGIDPGWSGALAVWVEGIEGYPEVYDCPPDIRGMRNLLDRIVQEFPQKSNEVWEYQYRAIIEAVWFFPQGGKNSAVMAENRMAWEMLFTCQDIPYQLVVPRVWQKIAQRERGKDSKQRAWRYARKRFPHLAEQLGEKAPTKTRGKSGQSDALCILAWLMDKGGSQ